MINKVVKPSEVWRMLLNEEEYKVIREGGTERPYSGLYWDHKDSGSYTCKSCGLHLFDSTSKFESGTGWPSFTAVTRPSHVHLSTDESHGMIRTEVQCARCDAHLGHVFPDGPEPTGMRFCINSLSLSFEPMENGRS